MNSQFFSPFHAPKGLKNPHIQTIIPKIITMPKPPYRREIHPDSSGMAQVAYDFIDGQKNAPLLVLFHGLEGSSQSHYAVALAHQAAQLGWHFVVPHYRGCGGIPNQAPFFYHSGDSAEISFVLNNLSKKYPHIFTVGISLGGNMLAKYLGESANQALCDKAAIISAPLDLSASAQSLKRRTARRIYIPYFLRTLIPKALSQCQDKALCQQIRHCKTLHEFDNLFTAPRHGFSSADDYYHRASAMPLLKNIAKPTLILCAQDDPFLRNALPNPQQLSDSTHLHITETGGHVGFVSRTKGKMHLHWLPEQIVRYFQAA